MPLADKINKAADNAIGAMLCVVVGVMPLVVRAAERPIPPEAQGFVTDAVRADWFAYWKSWFLIVPALVIAVCFLCRALAGRKPIPWRARLFSPPVAGAAVYLAFVLLSALLSPYRQTALQGGIDRSEGVFAQAAYMVVFLAAYFWARSERRARAVLWGVAVSSIAMGVIGLSQTVGKDFFATGLGSIVVTGSPGQIRPVMAKAYGTLFNPNTFGLYTAMLTPLLLLCGLSDGRRRGAVVSLLLAGALMSAGNAGASSAGGLAGIGAAYAVVVITYAAHHIRRRRWPHWTVYVTIGVLIGGQVLAYGGLSKGGDAPVKLQENLAMLLADDEPPARVDFSYDGRALSMVSGGDVLLRLTGGADGGLSVQDGAGRIFAPERVEWDARLREAQENQYYDVPGYGAFAVYKRPGYYIFSGIQLIVEEGALKPLRPDGTVIRREWPVRRAGFEGVEAFATLRGYIWSRALPLLLDHIAIGSGPDTFLYAFPQEDVFGKRQFMYDPYIIVDKAHNLYIQTGITTGGVSMLALLFLLGFYMLAAFLDLVRARDAASPGFGLQLGILAAVTAYAVASLATDATIGSAGVFWVLLGLGYARREVWPRGAGGGNDPQDEQLRVVAYREMGLLE